MSSHGYVMHRIVVLLMCAVLGLVACDQNSTPTPTPQPDLPTALAMNPPGVWIDNPIPGQSYTFDQLPDQIVAHASALDGSGRLEVRNSNDEVLATINLGNAVEQVSEGGQLAMYQGQWKSALEALLAEAGGSLTLKLVVVVGDVPSDPITLTILQATNTPTPRPTVTDTPTATFTPSHTPTFTLSPTITPTITPSPTLTPSHTPSFTISPSPTFTDTPSPTFTPTDIPEMPYKPKEEQPCRLEAMGSREVVARVGPSPSRAALAFLEAGNVYDVTGYNDDIGQLWWEFFFTEADRAAWVFDGDVYTTGSCLLVGYVEAPDVIQPPPPTTAAPPPPGEPVIRFFFADDTSLDPDQCTTLRWSVEFVDAVFLDGEGVIGNDTRQVCMPTKVSGGGISFTLTIHKDGQPVDSRTVFISYGSESEPEIPADTFTPTPTDTPVIIIE